ncbi:MULTISPECIES: hypothetical protein [Cohnella]|uniref:hypothetical protein n=1 Tax=Cohnella TaxID=329857 RepID=UPI0009B967CD|nr:MULTISPECIES: hypothetical protein [Cohnella]MBN2981648.1 hypothetical protein [Cohnella algarum]
MLYSFVIEPLLFVEFENEEEQLDKCKDWGLISEKATKTKSFYYRGNGLNESCRIVGYADRTVAVIEFDNMQRHCIHAAYLKEMQAANFGQRYAGKAETESGESQDIEDGGAEAVSGESLTQAPESPTEAAAAMVETSPVAAERPSGEPSQAGRPKEEESAAEKPVKGKAPAKRKKVELPEEKVKLVATVKEFASVPNYFADNDDEVIVYEAVAIVDPEIELGEAWSSYSATLKKLELAEGDRLTFEAKVIAKKLTKHPVPYKINNPSKIQKVGP